MFFNAFVSGANLSPNKVHIGSSILLFRFKPKNFIHSISNPLPTFKTVLPPFWKDWWNINLFCFGSWIINEFDFLLYILDRCPWQASHVSSSERLRWRFSGIRTRINVKKKSGYEAVKKIKANWLWFKIHYGIHIKRGMVLKSYTVT